MTALCPVTNTDKELVINNYRGDYSKYYKNVEVAFAIRKNDIACIKVRDSRDVWKSSREIDLSQVDFYLINRTYCSLY